MISMIPVDDMVEGFPAVPKGLLDICSKWLSRRAAMRVNEGGALEPAVVLIYLCHHPLGPKTRPIATNERKHLPCRTASIPLRVTGHPYWLSTPRGAKLCGRHTRCEGVHLQGGGSGLCLDSLQAG